MQSPAWYEGVVRRWVRRLRQSAAAALVIVHLGAALLGGTLPIMKDPLWPLVAWYADGLLMSNTWGMFSRPPSQDEVRVVGEREGGPTLILATTVPRQQSWMERVRDVRLRKIQSRLAKEDARREYGDVYLAYFCREAGLREVRLELHPPHAAAERGRVLASRRCTAGEPKPPRVRRAAPRAVGAE